MCRSDGNPLRIAGHAASLMRSQGNDGMDEMRTIPGRSESGKHNRYWFV